MKKQLTGNQGSAMVLAVCVIVFFAMMGVTGVTMISRQLNTDATRYNETQAFYAAEAGLDHPIDGVHAAPADSDHLDDCQITVWRTAAFVHCGKLL